MTGKIGLLYVKFESKSDVKTKEKNLNMVQIIQNEYKS